MEQKKKDLHSILQDGLELKTMRFELDSVKEVDKALGFPSKQFASVQIAGTNGKGSVATKIARALQANGKKVGLFTSPHIRSYHERIQVNGQPIPDEVANALLQKMQSAVGDQQLSYFEVLTLLAFCYFSEQKVDFAVLEVGMGGRLDATNIVKPVLSVITSIDLDHTQFLGETLEAIAYEKGGIIKPGVPAILGPNVKPHFVFEKIAEEARSPLFDVAGPFNHYEEENQAIARKALSLLPFPLEKKSIDCGLSATPPCRFEVVFDKDPVIILDVAHNPDGLRRTFERVSHAYPGKKIRVVAGFSADKDIEESLKVIHDNVVKMHLTHTNHPRVLPLGESCFNQAFMEAYSQAKQNREVLLICGTFFIMDMAKQAVSKLGSESGDD